MIKTSVESSNVSEIGWEDDALFVLFKRGDLYRYSEVPQRVYDDAVAAESVGKFLHANVFKTFPYTKVEAAATGFAHP